MAACFKGRQKTAVQKNIHGADKDQLGREKQTWR
jgi:hypothetical protein